MHRPKILLSLLFCLSAIISHGQNDPLNKLTRLASSTAGKMGAQQKAALDSMDFQFVMSVNDNAGFFDIQQKGETGSRLLYGLRSEVDKTLLEKVRDSLEIGIGMYEIRRYKMAEATFIRARNLMESNGFTKEVVYLRVMSNLGLIYLVQGQTSEAEKYLTTTLDQSEHSVGKSSVAYVANLNNYAKLHQVQGKYNEAEKEFDEALQRTEQIFGGGMQKAIVLNNKAMLYQVMGRYEDAVALMNQSMAASEVAPKKLFQGEKSFDNRRFQANMATMYLLCGKYNEAEQSFLSIRNVFENRKQTGNSEFAGLLNQLAILYIQMGKNDKVEQLLLESASIYKKRFTDQNIYSAKVINDLGNFYRLTERYTDAEKMLNKAFIIRETLLNPTHPDFVRSQEDLAILYWKTGRFDQAYRLYKQVIDKTVDFIDKYFPPMSESEKTKFWDVTEPRFQRFYNFALDSRVQLGDQVVQDAYNYHLATKALLLNATSKVRESILKSNNAELIKDYKAWLDLKEEIARTYAYSKKKQRDQNINLEEMERRANTMERSLSARSTDFSSGYSTQKIQYGQIRDLLGDNEAIVNILRVRGFQQNFTNDVRYVVLILKKGMTSPKMIVLDQGPLMEAKAFKNYRNSIQTYLPDNLSYNIYWSKIEDEISDRKVVYFSPDGVFNQMNVNTLMNADGAYMINQHDFVVLGNAKDLVGLKTNAKVPLRKTSFLLGFPNYGAGWDALPATKVEIESVAKILKAQGYTVNSFLQNDASEEKIKTLNGPAFLHIATHGFFLPDPAGGEGSVFGVDPENVTRNPLLRSGLILAGAGNTKPDGSSDITNTDNGVLTAFEAMNLNLTGTNLVILSACETALGDLRSGEGVYGLQRAFFLAGAKASIMSLWKVDDAATQELMTSFYTNYVKSANLQIAFKQAQQQLMVKYKEPYYWGAFVMVGM